jgi:hypothetical protein
VDKPDLNKLDRPRLLALLRAEKVVAQQKLANAKRAVMRASRDIEELEQRLRDIEYSEGLLR